MEDNKKTDLPLTEKEKASIYTVGVVARILHCANEAKEPIPASVAVALGELLATATLPNDKAKVKLMSATEILKAAKKKKTPIYTTTLPYLVKELGEVVRIIFRDILHQDKPDTAFGAQIDLFSNDTTH